MRTSGFRSGTTRIELLVVLIDSEVRTSAPQMLTNFGIGTLAAALARRLGAGIHLAGGHGSLGG